MGTMKKRIFLMSKSILHATMKVCYRSGGVYEQRVYQDYHQANDGNFRYVINN
jgi:hypothetical protein